MSGGAPGGRFSTLLLEGLDHYRKGRMLEAVRAWEEAYLLEPTNLRAREFLRSALERIHGHMGTAAKPGDAKGASHPWLPNPAAPPVAPPVPTPAFAMPKVPPARRSPTPPPPPLDALVETIQITAEQAQARAQNPPPLPPLPSLDDDPPQSPWDEGPSMAIPQPETSADEASGAWSIHKEPLPIEAVAGDDEVEVWLRGARELFALNDFSGALELLGKILDRKPADKEAGQMREQCEHNLTQMYESKIGTMDARPRIAIAPDEIIWLNLDPRAGFVLAQIDGEVSFDDLYAICGLRRLDTARILCELLEQGVVKVDGQDRAVGKRAMHRH